MASPNFESLHDRERAFFDAEANRAQIEYLDPRVLARYARPGSLFPREFMHRLLADLRGKSVLDVGCGEGEDALILSKLGAHVTGLDLSPGAIEVARRRLEMNRTFAEFICGPVEEIAVTQKYDIVWVEALLHHVLHDLDNVMKSLVARVRPGGMILMCEPVNLMPALRRLRMKIGSPEGTPDERPLEDSDLAKIRTHLPRLRLRYYRALGRLETVLPNGCDYEKASLATRATLNSLAVADRLMLSLPVLRRAASVAVMWSRLA